MAENSFSITSLRSVTLSDTWVLLPSRFKGYPKTNPAIECLAANSLSHDNNFSDGTICSGEAIMDSVSVTAIPQRFNPKSIPMYTIAQM